MPSILNGNQMDSNDQFEMDRINNISAEELDAMRKRRERSDLVSKELGKLLLRGYKMLDVTCDTCGCILMKLKNDPAYCVECEEIGNETSESESEVTRPVQRTPSPPLPVFATQPTQQTSSVIHNDDWVAKKLSELLLSGFKMLNSTCDQCGTILMQKREQPVVCVVCQEKADEVVPKPVETPQTREALYQYESRASAVTEPKRVHSTIVEEKPQNHAKKPSTCVEQTLRDKIEWANRELHSTDNLKQCIELCELIKSASEALVALERLSNKI